MQEINMNQDLSKERIQFLAESDVWREWCYSQEIGRVFSAVDGIGLVEYCTRCYSTYIGGDKCHTIECDFSGRATINSLFIPLIHQHIAILKHYGYIVESYESHAGEGKYYLNLWKRNERLPHCQILDDFTKDVYSSAEQALDKALIYVLEEVNE